MALPGPLLGSWWIVTSKVGVYKFTDRPEITLDPYPWIEPWNVVGRVEVGDDGSLVADGQAGFAGGTFTAR